MMTNDAALMDKGIQLLIEGLGHVEAERFIYTLKREKFDYTEWRKEYFGKMTTEEFRAAVADDAKRHPYTGNGEIL